MLPIHTPREGEPDALRENIPGSPIAIAAEALFLINLMLLPVIGFVLLVLLWLVYRNHPLALVRNHLLQTVVASLWGGLIVVVTSAAVFLLGGFDNPWSWVVGVIYFVCAHALFIVLGMIGLNHAILARSWRYPLFGPHLDA